MKKIMLLLLTVFATTVFGQQKTFDYAYINKKGICVYSVAEKKEYPIVKSGMDPCISSDGKKLAYTDMNNKGERFIAVINLSTKKKTVLNTHSNNSYGPVWSPDGKYIAYNVFDNKKSDWYIAIIDTNNLRPVVLTGKIKGCFMPSWCNNGKDVATHDMAKLYAFDMTGNIIQQLYLKIFNLSDGTTSSDNFIFTTDNKKIVYGTTVDEPGGDEGPPSAVFAYDLATKTIKRLSPKGYDTGQLSIKGNAVLFTGSKGQSPVLNIYSVNLDGTNFKVLFPGCRDISAGD